MPMATFSRNPRRDDGDPHAKALASVTTEKAKSAIAGLTGQPTSVLSNMLRAWGVFFPWDAEYEDSYIVQDAIKAEMKRRKQTKKGEA